MKVKRSCLGCKALEEHNYPMTCEFGYKIQITQYTYATKVKPLEECPKPTTYSKYFECLSNEAGRHQTMAQRLSTKAERLRDN